jgi:hypothetical protein
MKVNGSMIRHMVLENIQKQTLYMKANGKMISNMDKGWKFGKIKVNTKVILIQVLNMVLVGFHGMMVLCNDYIFKSKKL